MRGRSVMCTVGAVAAMTVAALGSGAATAATHTTATLYSAFSYHGLVVPTVRMVSGTCWTNSAVTKRDDAWRCVAGNSIYDPCFSSDFSYGVVVCPTPWNDAGTEIQLAKALPAAVSHLAPSLKMQPWAVETASGADCVLASVAGPRPIRGRHLNYFCGANSKLGLWGFPDRNKQPWTIFSAPLNATVLSHRVAVRRAWM